MFLYHPAQPVQTHGVLLQYLDLLTTPTVLSPEDYAQKIVPPLAELNEKYGISVPICMQIIRPMLNVSIRVSVEYGYLLILVKFIEIA